MPDATDKRGPLNLVNNSRRVVDHKRTYSDSLALALTITGSKEALSERLRVPLEYLHPFFGGSREMPHDLFLRVVDIVLESTTEQIRPPKEALQPKQN